MESIYLLVPIALIFVVIAVKLFFWAVDDGQYDDLESEGQRILFDEDEPGTRQNKQATDKSDPSQPS